MAAMSSVSIGPDVPTPIAQVSGTSAPLKATHPPAISVEQAPTAGLRTPIAAVADRNILIDASCTFSSSRSLSKSRQLAEPVAEYLTFASSIAARVSHKLRLQFLREIRLFKRSLGCS